VLEVDRPERANKFSPAATPWVIAADSLWRPERAA